MKGGGEEGRGKREGGGIEGGREKGESRVSNFAINSLFVLSYRTKRSHLAGRWATS